MKKIIAGGIFLIGGIILYIGIQIPAALYASKLGGWSIPPGRIGTALEKTGGIVPNNYSIAMIVFGVILVIWGCFGDDIKSIFSKIRHDEIENNADDINHKSS